MSAHEASSEPGAKPGTDAPPTEAFPILLVEDNEDDVTLLLLALKRAGVAREPYVVRDGADAIDYLAGKGIYKDRQLFPFPFLVLLDLSLPRRNGLEVLEWWASEPRLQHPRIIVLTWSVVRGDIERAYQFGAASYLVKSSDNAEFAEMLKRTLQFWSLAQRPAPEEGAKDAPFPKP